MVIVVYIIVVGRIMNLTVKEKIYYNIKISTNEKNIFSIYYFNIIIKLL